MDARSLLREMEADIEAAEDEGVTEITLKKFKSYLEGFTEYVKEEEEKDALQTQRDLAFYEAKHATKIACYNARVNRISDGFQAVITIGQGALKSGALINGGACVAILAFIGNVVTKNTSMISGLSSALMIFGFGLLLAAVASGTTYLSQANFERKKPKKAVLINNITIVIVILSYLSFLFGRLQSWRTIHASESQKASAIGAQHQQTTADPE